MTAQATAMPRQHPQGLTTGALWPLYKRDPGRLSLRLGVGGARPGDAHLLGARQLLGLSPAASSALREPAQLSRL
jgi:hypothetical protein